MLSSSGLRGRRVHHLSRLRGTQPHVREPTASCRRCRRRRAATRRVVVPARVWGVPGGSHRRRRRRVCRTPRLPDGRSHRESEAPPDCIESDAARAALESKAALWTRWPTGSDMSCSRPLTATASSSSQAVRPRRLTPFSRNRQTAAGGRIQDDHGAQLVPAPAPRGVQLLHNVMDIHLGQ